MLFYIACILMAGCRVAQPVDALVPFDMPDNFSATGENPLPDKWWLSLKDPNLDRVMEQGIAGNFGIQTVWDRLRQAEQSAVMAGADLYPSAEYQGFAGRTYERSRGSRDGYTDFGLGVSASYEVDLWSRVRSIHQAAMLDAKAAREDVDAAAISLSASLAQVWYRLAESKLQQRLIADQLNANEQMLTIIRLQFRQGLVGAANVFRQEQLVEGTRGQLILAQDTTGLLQHQLSVLSGLHPGKWWEGETIDLIALPDLPEAGLPAELLKRRPDLRFSQNLVLAADSRLAAAIAEQYPQFTLSINSETSSERMGELFDDWFVNFAANVTGPLFDAGFRKANAERSRAALSEAINQYGQDVLTAMREVEDALQQEYQQKQYLESLQRQLKLAQRTYERTRESYLKGQLDYIRVLESLVSTQALERNELAARRQLIEYRIELCRSLAGGWEMARPAQAQLRSATNRDFTNGT